MFGIISISIFSAHHTYLPVSSLLQGSYASPMDVQAPLVSILLVASGSELKMGNETEFVVFKYSAWTHTHTQKSGLQMLVDTEVSMVDTEARNRDDSENQLFFNT